LHQANAVSLTWIIGVSETTLTASGNIFLSAISFAVAYFSDHKFNTEKLKLDFIHGP